MSTSKPTLNSIFAARLARGNDPARKADLDAIAALEELQDQEDGNTSVSTSPSIPDSFHEAQTASHASKNKTHSAGLAGPDSTSDASNSYSATLPGGDGRDSSGKPECPNGAHQPSPSGVVLNASSQTPQSVGPVHLTPVPRFRLVPAAASEGYRRTDFGHAEQPPPSTDAPPSKRRKLSLPTESTRLPQSGALNGLDATTTTLPVSGSSNSSVVHIQASNLPEESPFQGSSHLEKMFDAGISPSDEMRWVFGRAVDRMLPGGTPTEARRTAEFGDTELDAHIRHVAPILATAYSQLVHAGLAGSGQLQDVTTPLRALYQSNGNSSSGALPNEISQSVTNSRKLKLRPPDITTQPSDIRPLRSSAKPSPSLQGVSPRAFNHAQDSRDDPHGERSRTRLREQSYISCGCGERFAEQKDLRDHREYCGDKAHRSQASRLLEEGTQVALTPTARSGGTLPGNSLTPQRLPTSPLSGRTTPHNRGELPSSPTTIRKVRLKVGDPSTAASTKGTPQTEVNPSRTGTVESGIASLDSLLVTLDDEIRSMRRGNSSGASMSIRVKDQALTTVVLEFPGPTPLLSAKYDFEVSQLEAEAAGRWTKRMDSFDPEEDYLEYTLNTHLARSKTRDEVPTGLPIADSAVTIFLNGKNISSLNALQVPWGGHSITSCIRQGMNTLEIFALVDASDKAFCLERRGPSKEEMLKQAQQAAIWRILVLESGGPQPGLGG